MLPAAAHDRAVARPDPRDVRAAKHTRDRRIRVQVLRLNDDNDGGGGGSARIESMQQLEAEQAMFSRLFSGVENYFDLTSGAYRYDITLTMRRNVLVVCATKFTHELESLFGETTRVVLEPTPAFPRILKTILLDLSTSAKRQT